MNTIHQHLNPSRELGYETVGYACNIGFAKAYNLGYKTVDVEQAIEDMYDNKYIQESPKEKKKKYREGLNKMMNKGKKW
jgi:hypothetical protein